MAVPYTFGSATSSIPLSQLDSNFATAITIGSTATYLGNTTTTLAGLTSVGTNTLTSAASTNLTIQSAGTTAMTIDTSQNVGIGTSSPGYKLDVSGTARVTSSIATNSDLQVNPSGYNLYLRNVGGTNRIDSYNFPITATVPLQLNASQMGFQIADTERMRIDSSGNLLVGTTSAASSGAILTLKHPSSASVWGVGPYSAGTFLVYNGSNGVYMTAGATSWTSTSDARLKNITGKYDNALADISQLEPVKFTWKSDADNKPQVGVLAQSVEKVVPEAIEKSKIPNSDDETEYLGVRYTELVPLLTAAIQELKAINDQQAETINALTARVVALEEAKA